MGLRIQNSSEHLQPIGDIVSFAKSQKKDDSNSIGEYGVGVFTSCFSFADASLLLTRDRVAETASIAVLSRDLQQTGQKMKAPRIVVSMKSNGTLT